MPASVIHARARLIESRQNARVKELRAALARSGRIPAGLLALEGEHLIREAMRSGLRVHTVFLRDGYIPAFELPQDAEHLLLTAAVFASAMSTEQPQGIAALVAPPVFALAACLRVRAPLLLVLDGLQDPGNVGTLLRSAEAFAASGVLLLPGSASAWNPKTLRASAGSAFRVPSFTMSQDEVLATLHEHGIASIAAVARGGADISAEIGAAPLRGSAALLIGNEGAGLSKGLLAAATHRVTIPMPGAVESLNAAIAGSLLLYEAARQRAGAPSATKAGAPS